MIPACRLTCLPPEMLRSSRLSPWAALPSANGRSLETTPSVTSVAAERMTAAIVGPNDFSPPIARTGIVELMAGRDPGLGCRSRPGRRPRTARSRRASRPAARRASHNVRASFAERARIGGELVPEAIEIDALAPGDQPLHVRPAEAEMPQQRVLEDLVPRADAWHRRIHHDEARDARRVLRGERISRPCCRCRGRRDRRARSFSASRTPAMSRACVFLS